MPNLGCKSKDALVLGFIVLAERTNPEVTKTDGVAMVLEFDEHFGRVRLNVGGKGFVFDASDAIRCPQQFASMMKD